MKKRVGIILTIIIVISIFLYNYKTYKNNTPLESVIIKENSIKKEKYAMYKENENGEYEEYNSDIFPSEGYTLNLEKSKCIDNRGEIINNVLKYENEKVIVDSNNTSYCYLYFDDLNNLKPKYSNKVVGENEVTFDISKVSNNSEVENVYCYCGEKNNITTNGTYNNNKCIYPSNVEYAKVCIKYKNLEDPICSEEKQLAWYFIKEGKPTVPIEVENTTLTYNSNNILLIITSVNNKRTGFYTTNKYDMSKFSGLYTDLSYTADVHGTTQPSYALSISDAKVFLYETYERVSSIGVYYWKTGGTYDETFTQPRKVFYDELGNKYINYTNDYIGFGRNASSLQISSNIYNIWFQYRD